MDMEAQEQFSEKKYTTTMAPLVRVIVPALARLGKRYPKAAPCRYSLRDCLVLALSIFVFKFPSMYQFLPEIERGDGGNAENSVAVRRRAWSTIASLLEVQERPRDITIRRRVDEVQTLDLAVLFGVLGTWIKRQKVWSPLNNA